ncbi:beta-N-acetyl-D-glucosaminide beta-1,4-N-acetylglucosaminyl-transferase [Aplysia californica]|uniref:Beta-1,4-galactosyltransferase n=1 Tax=Aplysia californica TaxID=6500 RepID=A0ABM0ZVS0_APLCA|nr:beta-N-acetyl-D-glucosaminide beta-1,4-N-acetylglucosaminyl-transferase [Aplysia californica]
MSFSRALQKTVSKRVLKTLVVLVVFLPLWTYMQASLTVNRSLVFIRSADDGNVRADDNVATESADAVRCSHNCGHSGTTESGSITSSSEPLSRQFSTPAVTEEVLRRHRDDVMPFCENPTRSSAPRWPSKEPVTAQELAERFPMMQLGGHYSPSNCTPREKLAILIPYRNRSVHLHTLLPNLIPMLIKQNADFTIFVVEQAMPTRFNKGVLFNAGFLEALKLGDFDCFILHDVDMIPLNDANTYQCRSDGPVHFMAGVNKFHYGLSYSWLLGGVLGFTKDQYKAVNGFSNLYFGWGAEDDDMFLRLKKKRMDYHRKGKDVGLYDMIRHSRDKGWEPINSRFSITHFSTRRIDDDGLNTAVYSRTSLRQLPLYTWIRVFVDMKQVYEKAPEYMKDVIEKASRENAALLSPGSVEDH